MQVQELIEMLKIYPPDAEAFVELVNEKDIGKSVIATARSCYRSNVQDPQTGRYAIAICSSALHPSMRKAAIDEEICDRRRLPGLP